MLKKEETILKEILWGERPVHHLSFVKIGHTETSEGHQIENPRHLNVVGQPVDIARGLLRYRNETEKLRSWARLVFCTPEVFSIDLGVDDGGEVLEKALARATNGHPLEEDALILCQTLVPSFPKKRFLGEGESIPKNP